MTLLDEIINYASTIQAELTEKKGVHGLSLIIAERKAFLTKKKLQYIAKFRIDDELKEIKFTEMLKESGSGFSTGGGDWMTGRPQVSASKKKSTSQEPADERGRLKNNHISSGKSILIKWISK